MQFVLQNFSDFTSVEFVVGLNHFLTVLFPVFEQFFVIPHRLYYYIHTSSRGIGRKFIPFMLDFTLSLTTNISVCASHLVIIVGDTSVVHAKKCAPHEILV